MTHITCRDNADQLSRLVRAVFQMLARSLKRGIHAELVCGLGIVLVIACLSAVTIGDDAAGTAKEVCIVQDPLITEASGLAVCRTTKDAVWIHNDSGDVPRLFLVGLNGTTQGIVNVKDVTATDWEDMCSFELDNESWLLIGDIGDNLRVRGTKSPRCQLLLLKEPKPAEAGSKLGTPESTINVVRTIEFQFPDGPHDCEGLAVDTLSRAILLVTKADPANSALYSLPLTTTKGRESLTAELVAPLSVMYATAIDISSDGRRMAIVNMFSGVMLTRDDPEKKSWADASSESVTALTLPVRKQGESVCFAADGKSLLLNSEGKSQPLWQVALETEE